MTKRPAITTVGERIREELESMKREFHFWQLRDPDEPVAANRVMATHNTRMQLYILKAAIEEFDAWIADRESE